MNHALIRARRGALTLGLVFLFAIVIHHWLTGASLLDSLYWTVITVAGVGYAETVDPGLGDARQWLTISVIVIGMATVAYTLGMMIQAIVEGQFERAMGARRMTKEIQRLKDHVIICGFGRIGQNLAHRLTRHRVPFVIVDSSPESTLEAKLFKYIHIEGDATDEDTLRTAGVDRAKTVVNALSSDADNVFLTLTVHNMNPHVAILSRGEHPRTEKKLLQAGATRVVLPAVIGAERMADIIIRPEASHLLRSVGHESGLNAELEEFKLTDRSPYVGKTVREAEEASDNGGVMIVALKRAVGETVFNPKDDFVLDAGDVIIVMGPEADIEQFFKACIDPVRQPALA
jgi:voltage-gated potassium channel